MAKKNVNIARDYRVKKVKLGDDFVIELKCRVVGLQYLEDVYDKPISKIKFDSGRVKDLVNLFTALGLSTHPDMTVEDIKRKVGQLDIDRLRQIMSEAPDIFGVQVKNSKKPSKKQQVKGNLTETD